MPQGAHEYEMWDAAYVLGALSDGDHREFEMHMAGCTSCREAVAELVGVVPLLSLAGDDASVPPCPDFLPSLLEKAGPRLAAASDSMPPLWWQRLWRRKRFFRCSAPVTTRPCTTS